MESGEIMRVSKGSEVEAWMRRRARGKWKLLFARLYFIAADAADDGESEHVCQDERTHQTQGKRW